jgi:hypothetical protein
MSTNGYTLNVERSWNLKLGTQADMNLSASAVDIW